MNYRKLILAAMLICLLAGQSALLAVDQSPLLKAMKGELDRSFQALQFADEVPLYYLSYRTTDTERFSCSATYGVILNDTKTRSRIMVTDCHVGNHDLDNTHEIRGEFDYSMYFDSASTRLPLEDDELAIRTIIWKSTDELYKSALERYTKVKTNQQVLVEREDTSADFSHEVPNVYIGEPASATINAEAWKERLKQWSAIFKEYPFVQTSSANLSLTNDNRFFVDSDGALIQTGESYARLSVRCSGTCEDGMQINRYESFDSDTPDGLPTGDEVEKAIHRLIDELLELLDAPLAEPYSGPAILVNRASGVFFHEIFGHRLEGHRQKSEMEGQTFAKKLGEKILPEFLDVYDDPTIGEFRGMYLRGQYKYDDEGVKSSRVNVVEDGVLKNFLMSRSPISNFANSNGHGRAEADEKVVARQGNLIIESSQEYPFDTLVAMLVAECHRQDKPYGLVFYDISGGFTQTGRYGPQSFKVIPLLVRRYYADGRPPEAIRGVDIVGTPLSSFEKIAATGDDYDVFNGTCGAESGWVPVSAVSPSVLVSQLEVEKKVKEQDKPPILGPPYKPSRIDNSF
jgi:predicted Zn-dependent protease